MELTKTRGFTWDIGRKIERIVANKFEEKPFMFLGLVTEIRSKMKEDRSYRYLQRIEDDICCRMELIKGFIMSGWVIDIDNKILYRHYKRFDGVYIRCCYIYYKNGYYIGVINSKKKKIYRSLSLEDLILKIDMILKRVVYL